MSRMKDVVIVIPVYRADPPPEEQASFRQCLTVLGRYDIVLLTHQTLDCSCYEAIAQSCSCQIRKTCFDARYFESVSGYNDLCLSPAFYARFLNYQYMLIYQLDAWVFRDELLTWCRKGYDFIGAPWFVETADGYSHTFCDNIGNGGFSLRRISFCYRVLTRCSHAPVLTPKALLRETPRTLYGYWDVFKRSWGIRNNNAYYLMKVNGKVRNEDGYFTLYRDSYLRCRIPTPAEAVPFSFEVHPAYLFSMNHQQLPFGCHAYRKYEYDTFWRTYIHDEL